MVLALCTSSLYSGHDFMIESKGNNSKSIDESYGSCALHVVNVDWPARESHRSLNTALDFYVWRNVRLAQIAVW